MSFDARNEWDEVVGMNSVSTPEIERFICAICSSDSKSDTARRPLTMKWAPDAAGQIDDERAEHGDLDVVEVGERLLDQRLAVLQAEQRLALLRVAHGRDDHPVEQPCRGLDDLDVPVVDRVERTRIENDGHCICSWGLTGGRRGSTRVAICTTVLP